MMSGVPQNYNPPAVATSAAANAPSQQQRQQQPQKSAVPKNSISDDAVLAYLKKKGMASAMLQLQEKLKAELVDLSGKSDASNNPLLPGQDQYNKMKESMDIQVEKQTHEKTPLSKSTGGGGFGYDRDAAAPIVVWGIPDNNAAGEIGSEPFKKKAKKKDFYVRHLGEREAQSYLDSFISLQLWVLSLPDDPSREGTNIQPVTHNPISKAYDLLQKNSQENQISLSSIVTEIVKPIANADDAKGREATATNNSFHLPPSAKPELLAVTFSLFVHTYCELLEVGMQGIAHVLRDTFGPTVYQPIYSEQIKDLYKCNTTEDMVRLNGHNSQHSESLVHLNQLVVRVAEYQQKQDDIKSAVVSKPNPANPQEMAKHAATVKERQLEYERIQQSIDTLETRHKQLSQKASLAYEKLHDLPFLRRARAVRWQLSLSSSSYGLLARFLNNHSYQKSLLTMSTLLQTKCEIHVEQRDPLPFTPAVLLDDDKDKKNLGETHLVNWAAPFMARSKSNDRPFPKFHLEEEYESEESAKKGKKSVEFNRAMLVYGFRRLEALERKREFQVMRNGNGNVPAPSASALEPSILLSTLCANAVSSIKKIGLSSPSKKLTSPAAVTASGVITTGRKTSSSSSGSGNNKVVMTAAMWEEAGIGLTCAKLCPPDGRRIAVGCDDSAVRIWNLMDLEKEDGTAGDATQVLLGHKNDFPVFDVSWNRDGRSLLSAGGDGTIRLWDTMLQGPYGNLAESLSSTTVTPKKSSGAEKQVTNAIAKETLEKATNNLEKVKLQPDMTVPGLKSESNVVSNGGAALAVYRHAEPKPIWSVAFAPCGYYFASAGADACARLWTTDRVAPVRLFCGHMSNSINSVAFHPNCNFIITGADDKTARLWDIQTGQCVRLLNGCASGIHRVEIDPSGQYAAGADVSGIVHLWDLGTSKKITEFRPLPAGAPTKVSSSGISNMKKRGSNSSRTTGFAGTNPSTHRNMAMCHALSFSTCGTALATGGDDRCVRIWDIRKATIDQPAPVFTAPAKSIYTRRSMLMDLQYTKRNLLLSVGKYINQ
jgi:WD40 repeat protein